MLGNCSGVGVVFHSAIESKLLAKNRRDRHIDPSGQVGRRLNHARCLIERAAATHADGPQTGCCPVPAESMSL